MIPLDRTRVCRHSDCRRVLPADPDHPEEAGFWVRKRRADGSVESFWARCRLCSRKGGRTAKRLNNRIYRAEVDGVERAVKDCSGCGRTRIAEEGAADSEFYATHVGEYKTFVRLCRDCASAARRQARQTNPQFRARETRTRQKWMAKEENRERYREVCRRWHLRYREANREAYRETQRMAYRLRRERAGLPPRDARLRKVIDGTRPEYPAAPFVAWLRAYQRVMGLDGASEVARALGLNDRRVRAMMAGDQQKVAVDAVSRALTESRVVVSVAGRTVVTLDDLYPDEVLREPTGRLR